MHTFVAVAVGEGEGTPVVAEVIRADDEIASAGRPWIYASIAAGFLALLALVSAIRTSGRPSYRSSGFGGVDDLRRERKNLLQVQKALERSRTEEANLRSELERLAGDLAEAKEALAAKESSIGEVESRMRAAEEQAARAEAELRAGVTVREEVARLIETELQTARSELAIIKGQHEVAQRRLESERTAEARRETAAADERLRGELDAAKANLDILSREMTELGDRYQESAARAAHAEAKVLDLNADLRELEDQPDPTGEIQKTHAELDRTRNELGAALQKVETLGAQLAVSRCDLEVVRGEQELGNGELEDARAELDAFRAELDAARADATSSWDAHDSTLAALDSVRTQQETTSRGARRGAQGALGVEGRARIGTARSRDRTVERGASAHRGGRGALLVRRRLGGSVDCARGDRGGLGRGDGAHRSDGRTRRARHPRRGQGVRTVAAGHRARVPAGPHPRARGREGRARTAKDQLSDREAQVAGARNELVAVRTSLQAATAKADALEAEIERAEAKAAELAAEVELRDAKGVELVAEVGRTEARAEAAEARAIDLSGRIEEGDTRLNELADRAERAEGLVTELAARAERAEVRADEMAERARSSRPPERGRI